MKKSFGIFIILAFIFLMLISACASKLPAETNLPPTSQDSPQDSSLQGKKLAGILPGPVNDGGWNGNAYAALVNARDKYQMDLAYTENTKVEDAEQIMRDYADAGYDVIMAHGNEYADQVIAVAKEYPNVAFIQTNGAADDLENLYTVTFSAGEGGYFMGRLACQITKTDKVMFIIGTDYPIIDHHIKMSRVACADIGRSDVEIIPTFIGSWNDPAKAKELTKAGLEQGVDVVISCADAGDTGVIEAVREAYDAGNTELRYISWSKDRNSLAPDFAIGGWEEDISAEVDDVMQKIAAGEKGGHFALGLLDGANVIRPFYGLVSPEVEQDIFNLERQYLNDPASIPNLVVRTDL